MNDSKTFASVVHQNHGRARLRFKSERGNTPFFDALVLRLEALPDVKRAEARPLTGSVVVHHQGPWSGIAEQVAEAGLFAIIAEDELENPLGALDFSRPELAKLLSKSGLFVQNEEQAMRALESLAPPLLAAGGAAALAVWQVARGHALPPGLTLLWYARALASPFIATLSKE